jgi:3-oxoacyl-[acyl-carrier-protein] synthase II
MDYVVDGARQTNPRVALNNAYAFGGNNASLCLKRWEN